MGKPAMAAKLRSLIAEPGIIVTPGVYDGLSARMVQQAGFGLAVVSGAAVSASVLGMPDLGIISMSEMVTQVRGLVDAVDIPVIADAEAGFGGVQNVIRTARAMEQAGVAGYIIEDQSENRKCGHFADKSVVPVEDMVLKLKAAVRSRENPDVLIMARTDALAIEGVDAAIDRARAYADAGADALFVEAPATIEQLEQIPTALGDLHLPLWANMAEGGLTPLCTADQLEKMGYKFACYPGGVQKVMVKVVAEYLRTLRATGSIDEFYPSRMATLAERSAVLGLNEYLKIETDLVSGL